jgi:hypothetical protein
VLGGLDDDEAKPRGRDLEQLRYQYQPGAVPRAGLLNHLDAWTQENAMLVSYPARYSDRAGVEHTTIRNDGKLLLSVAFRGVEFRGGDFDALEPPVGTDPGMLSSFTLQQDAICSCTIDSEIPVPVVIPEGISEGVLAVLGCLPCPDGIGFSWRPLDAGGV